MGVESANHALFALCFNKTKISFYFGKQTVREEKRKEDLFLVKLVTKCAGRYNLKKGTLKLEFFATLETFVLIQTVVCRVCSVSRLLRYLENIGGK